MLPFGDSYMGDKQQFLSFFKGPDTKAAELEDTYVKDDMVSRAGGVNILTWHLFLDQLLFNSYGEKYLFLARTIIFYNPIHHQHAATSNCFSTSIYATQPGEAFWS